LGLVYLFREIRKLRQLVSASQSVAPVREAPKVAQVRRSVAAPPPIQKARIVEEDDESSEEEEG
jgi:hypothetical protein